MRSLILACSLMLTASCINLAETAQTISQGVDFAAKFLAQLQEDAEDGGKGGGKGGAKPADYYNPSYYGEKYGYSKGGEYSWAKVTSTNFVIGMQNLVSRDLATVVMNLTMYICYSVCYASWQSAM